LSLVARAEGLVWTPTLVAPVTYLATLPIAWLPSAWIPLALNFFTALCAALSLVCLARCVALLPHDLSKQADGQIRLWVFTPPPLMTRRLPWLPPLLAVLLGGFQFSFWQHATSATGEMVSLLLFAYVVRCFFEFNASGRDGWLLQGALVYGLAVANDWFMVLFFPVFLLALLWVKRLFLFNTRQIELLVQRRKTVKFQLLWQIPACWFAGTLLVLLPPLLASRNPAGQGGFGTDLVAIWHNYQVPLANLPRQLLLTFVLIAVLPIFLIGLRFYHFLSGFNRVNYFVGAVSFQMVYGFFFLVGVWIMLDAPISPHRLAPGLPTLPLYFLEALALGFFAGHFLLTSETGLEAPRPGRVNVFERKDQQVRLLTHHLKRVSLVALLLLFAVLPVVLVKKNLLILHGLRANPEAVYLREVEAALPPGGAVLIGNDAFRLVSLQADLIERGRQRDYLVLNTEYLEQSPEYLDFIQKHSPGFNLSLGTTNAIAPERRKFIPVALLQQLGTNHHLYSLHPAAQNTIAEVFYYEAQGLVYHLQSYAPNQIFAPAMASNRLVDNQAYWRHFRTETFTNLVRQVNPPAAPPVSGLLKRFLNTFHARPETDVNALRAAIYYGAALNDWGVELQKTGQFAAARDCFTDALQLSPQNAAAQINQQFNQDHQAGRAIASQSPLETLEGLNQYRDLQHVLRDGAVDEPNFDFLLATVQAQNQLIRPAIAQFERVKALAPERLDADEGLFTEFAACHDFTNALAAANDFLARSPTNTAVMVLKATYQIQLKSYSQAITLLDEVITQEPTNEAARFNRGRAWTELGQLPTARQDFQTILQITPNDFRAYLALADLDDREHHPADAITHYESFLLYAPTNIAEIEAVKKRVQVLKTERAK
jgi:tetratricopeptide (TPR) repeat protein